MRAFQADGGPRPPYPHYLLLLEPGDHPTSPGGDGAPPPRLGTRPRWTCRPDRAGGSTAREMRLLTRRFVDGTQQADPRASLSALWSPRAADVRARLRPADPSRAERLRRGVPPGAVLGVAIASEGTYLFRFRPESYGEVP